MGLSPEIETGLKIGAGVFWSLAYLLIIRRGFIDRTYGMPLVAFCSNLAWEFTFTFIYPRDAPQSYINFTWFVLDLVILFQILRYWKPELEKLLPPPSFYPILIATLILSLALIIGLSQEFENWNGMYSAFGMNLMMSALFIFMLAERVDARGQSLYIGLCKMIGTTFVAILFFARDPNSLLMNSLYLSTFILDGVYVILLYSKLKALGLNPWKRF